MTKSLLIVFFFFCAGLYGQSIPPADSAGWVTIITEPAGADLYVDSLYVGKAPIKQARMAVGSHTVRAFYPSVFAWNAVVTQESLLVVSSVNAEKRMNVGEVVRIQSDPPYGIVRVEGRTLGTTPLYIRLSAPLAGDLIIEREGFDSLRVPITEIKNGMIRVKLRSRNGMEGSAPGDGLAMNEITATDRWLTYASGATMIVSGVASAYLKDRANRHFDAYSLTNNAADLLRTRTLDRQAAATLIISEISFAVLAYLLLSD
jgi:hypothetical protein